MSNAIPPSVVPPSPNEWPDTIRTITGITRDSVATLTVPAHGFTLADEGQTSGMIMQVIGMRQINGLPGRIQKVLNSSNFTVNIDTTNFTPYASAGVFNVMTGIPAVQLESFQYVNTPFQNIA